MTTLGKRIKRAEAQAKRDKAWKSIKTKPTRTAVSELRADLKQ